MTCVEEAGDVRMRQSCQNLPFRQETAAERGIVRAGAQELYRDCLRDLAIDAFGKINGSHAAAAEEILEPVPAALHVPGVVDSRQSRLRHLADVPLQ